MRFYNPHILNINLGIRGLKVKMSLYVYPHSTLCMRAANALVSLRIYAGSPDPLMLSIATKIKNLICLHYFINFLYHVYIEIKYY